MPYDKAIKKLLDDLKECPKDLRLQLKVAELYQKAGDLKEAATRLAVVAELYMEDGAALKAAAAAKQALKLDPTRIGSRLFIADLYERLGLQADAATQYRLALEFYQVAEDAENAAKMVEALGRLQSGLGTTPEH